MASSALLLSPDLSGSSQSRYLSEGAVVEASEKLYARNLAAPKSPVVREEQIHACMGGASQLNCVRSPDRSVGPDFGVVFSAMDGKRQNLDVWRAENCPVTLRQQLVSLRVRGSQNFSQGQSACAEPVVPQAHPSPDSFDDGKELGVPFH
jgi:hypothetical protein